MVKTESQSTPQTTASTKFCSKWNLNSIILVLLQASTLYKLSIWTSLIATIVLTLNEYDSFVAYCHGHFLTNKINQFCMTGSIVLDIVNTIRSLLCIILLITVLYCTLVIRW